MAETAINVVFSKFGELATRELAVLLQVGGDIMQLGDQLEWLQPIIRDTDRKRRAGTVDGLTRVWVRQTRNAAFDAEDALDEFFHKVQQSSRPIPCLSASVQFTFRNSYLNTNQTHTCIQHTCCMFFFFKL
ncbi:hypothetical protein ACQ4PT_029379 [Festuca glaucescens]